MDIKVIISIVAPIVSFAIGWFVWFLKDRDNMRTEIMKRLTKDDVRDEIRKEQRPLEIEVREVKDDVKRIEKKVDIILNAIIKNKK